MNDIHYCDEEGNEYFIRAGIGNDTIQDFSPMRRFRGEAIQEITIR